jgi:ABC-type uncharacterized transport system auxiliary subunit
MCKLKRVRRYISLMLVLTVCLVLCGCGDYRSLNALIFVSGIAVDKNRKRATILSISKLCGFRKILSSRG